jgi:hypothetical protein
MALFRLRRVLPAALVLVACLGASLVATASPDDRSAAESALKEVEVSAKKDAAAEPAARAKAALDRGSKLRAAGDEAHARLADRLARTWAEVARDVARAATVEDSAGTARLGASDAGLTAERERALLEEAVAQSGRLRAQLESASRAPSEKPTRTSSAASADAGTRAKAPSSAPKTLDGGAR